MAWNDRDSGWTYSAQVGSVRKFADKLEPWADGILDHCDYPIHTCKPEDDNNKIMVIRRNA